MATFKFKVRTGFTVCLGGPNANDPAATVYTEGSEISLSDSDIAGHLHKLDPLDVAAATKLTAITGIVHVPLPNPTKITGSRA